MPSKKLKENNKDIKSIEFSKKSVCVLIIGLMSSGETVVSKGLTNIYDAKITEKENSKDLTTQIDLGKDISYLNGKLLSHFGMSWDTTSVLPDYWEDEMSVNSDFHQLKKLLSDNLDGPLIVRDPKLVLMLPIWLKLLKDLAFDLKVIIVHRHPDELSDTLKENENFPIGKSHLLYIKYMQLAEKLTRDIYRIFVDDDTLLKNSLNKIIHSVINPEKGIRPTLTFDEVVAPANKQSKINPKTFDLNEEKSIVEKTAFKLCNLYTSIRSGHNNSLVFKKLDQIYNQYNVDANAFYKGIIYAQNYLSKLVIKYENGKEKILTKRIWKGRQILSFDLKNFTNIESISLYPSNELSYLQLGTISSNLDGEPHDIIFSSFNNIIHHDNKFIVNDQNRIYIDCTSFSNNIYSIDFEINLLATGQTTFQFFEKIATEKEEWFYDKFELSNERLLKTLAEKKIIKKAKKKAIKQLNKQATINAEQSNVIDKLTITLSKLQLEVNIGAESNSQELPQRVDRDIQFNQLTEKAARLDYENKQLNNQLIKDRLFKEELERNFKQKERAKNNILQQLSNYKKQSKIIEFQKRELKEQLNIEKEINSKLQQQINENQKRFSKEKKQHANLMVELGIVKQITSELKSNSDRITTQLEIEKHKRKTLNKKTKQDFKQIKKLSKQITLKSHALTSESKSHKASKIKIEKLTQKINEFKQKEEQLKSELNLHIVQQKNTLETSEKYKSEVTALQDKCEERNEVINKQHHEILKFKTDYAVMENYIAALKQSKSYQLGRFLTAPFRYIYDLVFQSHFVKNKFWLFFSGLFILLRYPFRFLQHANSANMVRIKNAIKNEPPKQILTNLKNFLSTGQSKTIISENHNEIETSSSPVYMSKWDEFIRNKSLANTNARSKILFISPELPQYDKSSGGKRATRMLSLLAEEMDVYVYTTAVKPEKYVNKLEENGVHVVINSDLDTLRKKINHFDSIIFAWYYTYLESHRLIELYPNAKIIVDSVDVHWVREERSIGNWEGFTSEMAAKNKEGEVYTYKQADIVWAVTENDKAAINNEIPNKDIRVISNVHTPIITEYVDPKNNNILFFGGFGHYPNVSAVKLLATQILPMIQKEISDCKLIIAGSNATQEIKDLGKLKGVEFRGFIEEEDVTALYAETFLSVSPLLAGAGIKGKICEAIAHRIPVVTNAIGNEGINLENEISGFIKEDLEELARLISKVMRREFDLATITKRAQDKMDLLVGPALVKERMIASIIPEITICIVTYNRMDLLKRCIESIEGNTKYPRYKIVVHSNGCTDGTVQYLEAAATINKKIIPVLSDKNEVFVIPNNKMMMMHDQNDIVLLNNDTFVTNNWLTELHNAAYSSSEIGIAGSKILYPNGKLQEFGSELYENGSGRNIGKWDDPNIDEYQKAKRVGYVSGCSMYIKRSTINRIGIFDLQFHPCYCEDSDYCYTAWENDIQTIVTPNSIVYHDEGATSGTDTSTGFKKYQKVNFEKFLVKHKTKLATARNKIEQLNGIPIDLSQ